MIVPSSLAAILNGQSALITGGARRIGRSIALALGSAGADVTVTYRTSQSESAEVVAAIKDLGRRAFAVQCDVRSEASVKAAVAATVSQHGHLNLLINNAAIFETAPLPQLTVEQWDSMFETNTRGPFLMAREALAHLRQVRGRIINLGSLGGLQAWAGHAHYCASKAALHMLTQAMAKGFAPDVAVNCVAPGWIEQAEDDQELCDLFASRTPMQRNGTAEDVAEAVLFFASATSFITGQTLTVDGGLGL